MPNLTITITSAQATRLDTALRIKYANLPLAGAPLQELAKDYIISILSRLVADTETDAAYKQVRIEGF